MSSKLKKAALAALLLIAMASLTLAQGPLHKRINYSINAKYSLRLGDYILPPGDYVLYQISANDLNLFALYQKDMARAPIAMIRTTRISYSASDYPEHTRMLLDYAESDTGTYPVIQGWTIPGEDGWQIISVVANKNKVLARIK